MTADTDVYACGNLGGGDADDIIAEACPLAGRDSDGRERHEDAVGADDLQQLRLVYVLRVDLIVIDDRAQARTRERDLCVRVLALEQIGVQTGGKRILAEVGQTEQRRKADTAHAAHQCTLLRIQAIRENALVTAEVQGFVLLVVIGLLKYGDVVHTALVQISVLIHVERINLDADDTEILARQLNGFTDVGYRRHGTALAGQNEDFLQTGLRDGLQFLFDLVHIQLGTTNLVMTVKTAVNAVIFAVIGDVQRREHLHRVAEMLARFGLCALRHLLKERQRRGRQQCAEVLRRENVLAKRTQYVSRRIGIRVIGVHAGNDLVLHLGADIVHTRLVLHVIGLFSDIFCGDDLRFFVFHDKYLSVFAQIAHLIENFNPAGNRSAERMPKPSHGHGPDRQGMPCGLPQSPA